ncbi:MAG: hypothetical protein ACU0GG_08260 [Paracoccaceae bacterium]
MTKSTETEQKSYIDGILTSACNMALQDTGASLGTVLDRLVTMAVAHAVAIDGQEATAAAFRDVVEKIEGGMFADLEGTMTAQFNKKH